MVKSDQNLCYQVRPRRLFYLNDIQWLTEHFSQLRMIGFVTWPPFLYHHLYEGGQVTANHSCENAL